MVIEQRIWNEYPELREAQFCGLASIAHNSRKVTMDAKIRDFVPPTLLRINDILNAMFALFVDELSDGATAYADTYRKLPAFRDAEKLFTHWKEKSTDLKPGGEYELVDDFGEFLGIRDWYDWKKDRGFIPPEGILDDVQKEGTTNSELLKAKAPASVMHLLSALRRYQQMEESAIRAVLMEIAVIGMQGLDYASSEKKYELKTLPSERFSGLEMMCLMYAAGQRLMPGESVGMNLNDEYLQALQLFASEK